MKQHEYIAKAANKKILVTLGIAAALGAAALLPVAVRAQDDQIGTNAPHQERNPSQHPELFTPAASRLGQGRETVEVRFVAATTTASRRPMTAPRTVIAAPAEVTAPRVNRVGEAVGTGAPHQERNPSQHPELWVQGAGR